MAAELMLINPRRRRKHRRRARAARITHARRNPRRRRRMSALQEKYFGGGRRRRHRRRIIRARRNPRRRHYRVTRMRRNPSVNNPVNFVTGTLVPAGIGAIGGIASNYIFDNYAPASLQTGILNPVSRLGLAALLGFGAAAVTDNRTGAMVGAGAMTITLYDMIESYMQTGQLFSPGYAQTGQGGGYGQQGMGRFLGRGNMGRVLRGRGMGYMNPARQMGRFVR